MSRHGYKIGKRYLQCNGCFIGGALHWEIDDQDVPAKNMLPEHIIEYTWRNDLLGPTRRYFDIAKRQFIEDTETINDLNNLIAKYHKEHEKHMQEHHLKDSVLHRIVLICTNCGLHITRSERNFSPDDLAKWASKDGWTTTECSQYGIIGVYCPKCSKKSKKKEDCHLRDEEEEDYD